MKSDITIERLLSVGLPSDIAKRAHAAGFMLSSLRTASKGSMRKVFSDDEIQQIESAVKRQPIQDEVVAALVKNSEWSCCLCWNLASDAPVIIHHIIEHSKTADDSYDNLVVLCPNHHALAHSKWEISQSPASPDKIRSRKAEFQVAIAEFRLGQRSAPGKEGSTSDPETHSDLETLTRIASFMDRPAMRQPLQAEGSMHDFIQALSDIIQALGTGVMKTRGGDNLGLTKPVRTIANQQWRGALLLVRQQVEATRTTVQQAVRSGEMELRADGFYAFRGPELPKQINGMRADAIDLLNDVLGEARIQQIEPFRRQLR